MLFYTDYAALGGTPPWRWQIDTDLQMISFENLYICPKGIPLG